MIYDLEYRQGSICQIYDHNWQATNEQGKYQCSNCKVVGYCSGCLLTIPKEVTRMRCEKHKGVKRDA